MYIISQQVTADGKLILNLAGKSSETKPTGGVVADGSTFLEENTDAFWKLDGTWKLEKAGQMKDLPVVDSGDNGKVMKVAEGAWAVGLDNGLPLSFPTEDAANANKFVGFDANGDYTAKEALEEIPSITGKNGKILGVTLDAQEHEQTEWVNPPADELPSMTGNNGKVLGVTLDASDNEQAEWVDAPVGKLILSLVDDGEGNLVEENGVTISEIIAARDAGQTCELVADVDGGIRVYASMPIRVGSDGSAMVSFTAVAQVGNGGDTSVMGVIGVQNEGQDTWRTVSNDGYQLPTFTTADIGKVLGVVSDGEGGAMLDWVTPQ